MKTRKVDAKMTRNLRGDIHFKVTETKPQYTPTLEATLRKDLASNWPPAMIEKIVRVVNAHEELLAHLRTMVGIVDTVEDTDDSYLTESEKEALKEARQAIAKAKSK